MRAVPGPSLASPQPSPSTPISTRLTNILPLLVGVSLLIWLGYNVSWTGFGSSFDSENKNVSAKTLWDWLDLLIVPAILALGAWLLDGSRKASEDRLEADRQRQKILDDYVEHMTKLLIERTDRNAGLVQIAARSRTLVALRVLDGGRKAQVLQLLYEAGFIGRPNPFVNLIGADFSDAQLDKALLEKAQIRGAYFNHASFRGANLTQADLIGCDFGQADFTGAITHETVFRQAMLQNAVITKAQREAADVEEALLPN
jgi:hypothetical protein